MSEPRAAHARGATSEATERIESQRVTITTFEGPAASRRADLVAHEEPLEIQVQGVSLAVLMRTPGHDEELALGYLTTERVIERADQVLSVRHCATAVTPEAEGNVLRVVLREGVPLPLERLRRSTFVSSSCGMCGKATIEAALHHGPPVRAALEVAAEALYALPAKLRQAQRTFDETGGLHAAALFDAGGAVLLVREDVGRHNAVDKVVGAALRGRLRPEVMGLFVSGRVSFEIVQKAAAFGLPIVAGISAPTSLAARFGEALGVTVIGFLRGRSMNVYAHAGRIGQEATPPLSSGPSG
jgi:FdhD protein